MTQFARSGAWRGLVIALALGIGAGGFAWELGGMRSSGHPYRRTEALGYLPMDCPGARVYVDVAALWAALGSPELLSAAKRSSAFRDTLAAFDAAGIDFSRDIDDFALCAGAFSQDDEVRTPLHVVLGGRLGGTQALERYKSVIESLSHVDVGSIVEERRQGVSYLVSKFRRTHNWIAMPVANVLVFSTEDVAELDTLAPPHAIALHEWQAEPDTTAAFEIAPTSHGTEATHLRGHVTREDSTLVIDITAQSAAIAKLDAVKIEALRAATVASLGRTALKPMADPVERMTLELAEGRLHAVLRTPDVTLGGTLLAIERDPTLVQTFLTDLLGKRDE